MYNIQYYDHQYRGMWGMNIDINSYFRNKQTQPKKVTEKQEVNQYCLCSELWIEDEFVCLQFFEMAFYHRASVSDSE